MLLALEISTSSSPRLAIQATRDLIIGHSSEATALGIIVTALSLLLMPALGVAKHRLGSRVNSRATVGEGTENIMCAVQAAAVLIGLAVTATLGWNWIDPVVALLLAAWAISEGREAWESEEDE